MIKKKFNTAVNVFMVLLLTSTLLSCAMTPEPDTDVRQQPQRIQTAENLLAKGLVRYRQNDYEQAAMFFSNALQSYRSIDNPEGIVLSCINLSKTSLATGNIPVTEAFVKKAKKVIRLSPELQSSYLLDYLMIIDSSIKIEKMEYDAAIISLQPLLDKKQHNNIDMSLAAVQNRVRIAIAKKDSDAIEWAQSYADLVTSSTTSKAPRANQKARSLRFNAALSNDTIKQSRYYHTALNLYRHTTHQTGIAATLEEWAQQQYQLRQYHSAKDKLMRALFIRIDLKDKKNTAAILLLLQKIDRQRGNTIQIKQTNLWLQQLSSGNFDNWSALSAAYNNYP